MPEETAKVESQSKRTSSLTNKAFHTPLVNNMLHRTLTTRTTAQPLTIVEIAQGHHVVSTRLLKNASTQVVLLESIDHIMPVTTSQLWVRNR